MAGVAQLTRRHTFDLMQFPPPTQRLIFRSWRDDDLPLFAAMNADPDVRRYFPSVQSREESDASVGRFVDQQKKHGHTFWATELRNTGEFIGFVGLVVPDQEIGMPADCLEAGWRLGKAHWGQGLATEAARACVDYAFSTLGAPAVGAITTVANQASIKVMKKVGMRFVRAFAHPKIEPEDPIAPHVLYVIENAK